MLSVFVLTCILELTWVCALEEVESVVSAESNNLSLEPYSRQWDFEDKDPFLKWASDGEYTVHYKGLTAEKASTGKKSFKLNLTFDTASYVYFMIPVNIPNHGELFFKGDIVVGETSGAGAALGTNVALYPCPLSGVNILQRLKQQGNTWVRQTSDLVDNGEIKAKSLVYKHVDDATWKDVGVWTNRIGLFLFGKPGATITVYVDNLSMNGNVPGEEEYLQLVSEQWQKYQEKHHKDVAEITEQLGEYKAQEVTSAQQILIAKGYLPKKEFEQLEYFAEEKKYLPHNESVDELVVFSWNPTSENRVTPFTYPVPSKQTKTLQITACPGEYEPASFVLRAQKDIKNIKITRTDLHGQNGDVIPASALDVKWVKCWYQAGYDDVNIIKGKKFLTPELLLKDDSLIKVDYEKEINLLKVYANDKSSYINITDTPFEFPVDIEIKDAEVLTAISLSKNTNKQVWLTSFIPPQTKHGLYSGTISISGDNLETISLPLTVEVLDFKLPQPPLEYSIYYTGKLVDDERAQIGSRLKNSRQYRLEMEDLKQHGIESTTLYQQMDGYLEAALRIRNESGMNNGNLYVLGQVTGNPAGSEELKKLQNAAEGWVGVAKKFLYSRVFMYGMDEADNELVMSQQNAWEAVHAAGAGVLVACSKTAYKVAEGLLDIGVLNGELDANIAEEWHQRGLKVFSYGNPQVGVENPGIYRQKYGFDLWLAGYDGAMDYAYQAEMGDVWNDFDHPRYRDHVFAYPATDSLIDTIQWQGFREAVDDTRYINLLLLNKQISKKNVERWLAELRQIYLQPVQIRKRIIERLERNNQPIIIRIYEIFHNQNYW